MMEVRDFGRRMRELERQLQRQLAHDLPIKVGNLAVRLFERNFQREGFFGRRWREVQRRIPGTQVYKAVAKRHPKDHERKILTGRNGNLGRSIQADPHEGSVTIHSDLDYAAAHNEGTRTAGRSHNVRIPKRQFIGDSPELEKAVEELVAKEIDKLFKNM